MVAQVLIVFILNDGRNLLEGVLGVLAEGGNLTVARVSPTIDPRTTLGFLGGWSAFLDGFLLAA